MFIKLLKRSLCSFYGLFFLYDFTNIIFFSSLLIIIRKLYSNVILRMYRSSKFNFKTIITYCSFIKNIKKLYLQRKIILFFIFFYWNGK